MCVFYGAACLFSVRVMRTRRGAGCEFNKWLRYGSELERRLKDRRREEQHLDGGDYEQVFEGLASLRLACLGLVCLFFSSLPLRSRSNLP